MHAKHVPFDGGEYTPTNNRTHLSTIVAPYQHIQRTQPVLLFIVTLKSKTQPCTQQIKPSIRPSKINLQFIITARMEF